MKKPPSKVAHNWPPTFFFMYWPGCPNSPEKEIPYHQKLFNAGLGIQTGETLKTNRFLHQNYLTGSKRKLKPSKFCEQIKFFSTCSKIKWSIKWILNICIGIYVVRSLNALNLLTLRCQINEWTLLAVAIFSFQLLLQLRAKHCNC